MAVPERVPPVAREPPDMAQQGPEKRRRLTVEEVEAELQLAGLTQPALLLLRGAKRPLAPSEPTGTQDVVLEARGVIKRLRLQELGPQECDNFLGSPTLTMNTSGPSCEALVPHRSSKQPPFECRMPLPWSPQPKHLVWESAGTAGIAIDPFGTAFFVSTEGLLITELPPRLRPRIILDNQRCEELARLALDSQGTAYLLTEDYKVLMTVQATSSILGLQPVEEIQIKVIGSQDSRGKATSATKCASRDELYSPDTDISSPCVEDITDDDGSMDWEDV